MGNTTSKTRRTDEEDDDESQFDVATRAQKVVGDIQAVFGAGDSHHEENTAISLIDSMCGASSYFSPPRRKRKNGQGVRSYYSEDGFSEDDSRTISEEETTVTDYQHRNSSSSNKRGGGGDDTTVDDSYVERRTKTEESSYEETDDDTERLTTVHTIPNLSKQPLASSFAKRCYFTKGGIGGSTQHYEGLTLNGNVVLMLAAAMKLKGCPTICDEDLRRVEQTYPNQFSRLPDELLLSSGWRRISKYCHFSNKPIPDGIPFFHSKERLKDNAGYYFLLAAAVGMVRPLDVEPLNRDTLVLLETDFPGQCDVAPRMLIENPMAWILVDKFCFFSGGPINTEEDVYYEADFDGNSIFMLAFLSPCLTPTELYKLDIDEPMTEAAVHEVESVYDLTQRDFDDLKLYHLGPCRALPSYVLQPQAWRKVLPPPFLTARDTALSRSRAVMNTAEQYPYEPAYDEFHPTEPPTPPQQPPPYGYKEPFDEQEEPFDQQQQPYEPSYGDEPYDAVYPRRERGYNNNNGESYPRQAFDPEETKRNARYSYTSPPYPYYDAPDPSIEEGGGIDPPEDEPPSLRKPRSSYYEQPEEHPLDEPQEAYYDEPQHSLDEPTDEYYDQQEQRRLDEPTDEYYDDQHPLDERRHQEYYDDPRPLDEQHQEYYDDRQPLDKHHKQYYDEQQPLDDRHQQYYDEQPPDERRKTYYVEQKPLDEHHKQYYDEEQSLGERHKQYYDGPQPLVEDHKQYYGEQQSLAEDHKQYYDEQQPLDELHDEYYDEHLQSLDEHDDYVAEDPLDEPYMDAPSIDEKFTSPMSETDYEDFGPKEKTSKNTLRIPMSETSPTMAIAHEVLRNQRNLTPMSSGTVETDGSSEYSSVWTEHEPDRTSRRALILQMARARMNKQQEEEKKVGEDIDLVGELD